MPHERLGDRLAGPLGVGRQRGRGVGGVVDGVGGEHVDAAASRAAACSPRPRARARPARSGSSSTASRSSSDERLQRGPLRRAVEERAVLQPEQEPDAARGGLRPELAAGFGFLVDESQDRAEELGPGVALREAERHRAVRVRRLISAIQCISARVPS